MATQGTEQTQLHSGVKVLTGFAGFGSFMQDKSVQTLVTESVTDYSPPTLPVSSDPAEHGMVVSRPTLNNIPKPQSHNYMQL